MKDFDKSGVYTRDGEDIKFYFHTHLNAAEKWRFVKFVTDTIVDDGNYYAVIEDMIFDYGIIRTFTDVDMSEIDDSRTPLECIEKLLSETNIVDIVKANALPGVIDELKTAVDWNIEYRTGIKKDAVAKSISRLLDTIEEKVSSIDNKLLMNMAKVISDVPDEFTADKMLDAFAKTDIYKSRHANVVATDGDENYVGDKAAEMVVGAQKPVASPFSPVV